MTGLNLRITIFAICFVYSFAANAQNSFSDTTFIHKATAALNELTTKQPIEKVYLHLDKPYYAAGDDIWFSAYVTSGGSHQLSAISGVLNVELISEKGGRVQTIQLPLKYGLASGDFHLPYTIAAGRYHIRAYTNYMRNWGTDYFFDQPITIAGVVNNDKSSGNTHQAAKVITPPQSSANTTLASIADMQFLPEGGNLVNGINSRVAFKAIDANGKGINVKGVVVDNKGMQTMTFASQHLGMGSFNFYPVAGTSYAARLTFDDSSHTTVNLPAASNSGYALRVANNNADVIFRVSYVGNSAANIGADSTLVLIAQSGGYTCYAAQLRLRGNNITGRIPKDKIPTGISQFTLFKQSGEPICERLIFINNHDQLKLVLTDSNKTNITHQLTTIKLKVQDADNKPLVGSFSAAVVDDSLAPDSDLGGEENILSYLLLTSAIKGKIESPGYYLKNDNDTTAAALDLLMLTQGYRHYEWKQVLNNKIPPLVYQPENGIKVTGHLVTASGKPAANGNVTLFNKKSGLLLDTVADEHGNFVFNNLMFTDSLKVLLMAKAPDGKQDAQVNIDKVINTDDIAAVYADAQNRIINVLPGIVPASYQQIADRKYKEYPNNGMVLLNEVKINSLRNKPMASKFSANLNGAGNADQVLTSKDLENQGGLLNEILSDKIYPSLFTKPGSMKIMLDGTPFSGHLRDIDPSIVESVEVLKHAAYTAIYGAYGMNGIIIITTKTGKSNSDDSSTANSAAVTLQGFYKARVFYSPKYDGNKTDDELADMRSTIYWNPNIVTDKDGNASFNYFNTGTKSSYRVIVQGIDVNGKLGYQLLKYKVE